MADYMTDGKGNLNRSEVDIFFKDLSRCEEEFFKQHTKNAKFNEDRRKRDEEKDKTYNDLQKRAKLESMREDMLKSGEMVARESSSPTKYDIDHMNAEEFEKHEK